MSLAPIPLVKPLMMDSSEIITTCPERHLPSLRHCDHGDKTLMRCERMTPSPGACGGNRCFALNDTCHFQVYSSADGLLPFITRLLCSVIFLVFLPASCTECCNIPEQVFLSRQVCSRENAMGWILPYRYIRSELNSRKGEIISESQTG
ncbi:hypothetical protein AVEN_34439-1 [Araneus ventricosus]|uniref:Uncharacterized protein n=1 Tax=Araneus ventricosus TaxID=182803 RepID=A0A4Y2GWZ0_ARAVE|nr:hypothetical protein AVEN_34439-1 [Araneus ventricosus]